MTVKLDDIKDLLLKSEKPSRYTGGEYGLEEIFPSKFNMCICFPDVYEVGTSNLGIKIVAESIKKRGYTADFCYTPWKDFGEGLKQRGIPLYSLSMKKPLAEFDMLGFSLQYELSYTNVLYMLDLAGIPFLRKDRKGKNYPIIAFGGPCTVNPEPLADIADVIFIGDGESVDADVADLFVKCGGATDEFYKRAALFDGVYIPKFLKVNYSKDGRICGFEGKTKVKKAICYDLDKAVFPKTFAVPNCESVHDRAVIEVMRGCYRGCRFCQAGFIYRPVRRKSVQTLTQQTSSLIKNTGYREVSMNSLSTGDYKYLKELIKSLKETLPQDVTLALPSLRVDSFDGDFAQDARRISLTFAPEAGSQRLRDVINKDITEEEILKAAESAFNVGYSAVKLYFMLGLPTETEEDLKAIKRIVSLIKGVYNKEKRAKSLRISVSVSTFIPKPFTPFQWERQICYEESLSKQELLKKELFIKGVSLSWSDYFTAKLEAALARGDRRLCKVIISAYHKGCKFDGWIKELKKDAWQQAFEENGLRFEDYTREWEENEILPWDFIDISVSKKFLFDERKRAYAGEVTGSCQTSCKGCGMQNSCPAAKGDE